MSSQTGKQIIIIHILPDISGNKVDQTRKLGQFIKYNIRNIFIEISWTKCAVEIIPRPLS